MKDVYHRHTRRATTGFQTQQSSLKGAQNALLPKGHLGERLLHINDDKRGLQGRYGGHGRTPLVEQ
jgi:hypothetical protein